jgi:putative ABC transport system permease protein
MWRHYLTVGWRALSGNRTYAVINIGGLAIGLAACLLLLLYVRHETSYDRWVPNAANVYQLQSFYVDPAGGSRTALQMSPYAAGVALAADFPQVVRRVYALAASPIVMRNGQALQARNALFVDGPFFDVLQLPLARGDAATALSQAGSVVLGESEARRYFGAADPVGRTLTIVNGGVAVDHRVTGVMRDLPRNSHLDFNMVARFDPASHFAGTPDFLTDWGSNSGWNYVALRPGTDVAAIRAALPAWERRNVPDRQVAGRIENAGTVADWDLANIRDVHLGEAQGNAMKAGNDRRTIATFAIVALLILGVACVNFTTLATAWASRRAREIALRKVVGASLGQLVLQFLSESIIIAGLAMLLALATVELLLPTLSAFLDADLAMTYLGDRGMFVPILLLTFLVGAIGAVYPAFYVSRLQPARILKVGQAAPEGGAGRLRTFLVILQFAVSIGLIICTWVVHQQTVLARNVDPGFRRDGLIQIAGIGRPEIAARSAAIAREIERVEGVVAVGRSNIGISTGLSSWTSLSAPGRDPVHLGTYAIDDGFFATMDMDLVAGRNLDAGRPMDLFPLDDGAPLDRQRELVARGLNVVINQSAARQLGFADPARAVGAQLRMDLVDEEAGLVPVTVAGIVRDARFRSIHQPIDPIVYRLADAGPTHLIVRYDDADPHAVRERIAAVWRRLAPEIPFEAEYSEQIVAGLYEAEAARTKIFAGFAILAILVACLGLFGLAAFAADRRTREIGIRKVFGARSRDIVRLLAWQFSKPVIVANLIAWPVAWWVMRDWLDTFDARIALGPVPFLAAGLLAFAIAVGTIAGHALKVSRANPIHALRYE